MTVRLCKDPATAALGADAEWVHIPMDREAPPTALEASREKPGLPGMIEQAFDRCAPDWWALGKAFARDPSAALAHAPACVTNASDFGMMLVWTDLVAQWATDDKETLVICRDPWLFRHLSQIKGVRAGAAPDLLPTVLRLAVRGLISRILVIARVALASVTLRQQRDAFGRGSAALLVYGHPASNVEGRDGYFGDLLRRLPHLARVLHVDCPLQRAKALAADGRTISLHAFGKPTYALALLFARWRPSQNLRSTDVGWLVKRAAAREGSTGQAAMIMWQNHCQARWLQTCRPAIVAWPWENHSWERSLVREASRLGVQTVGYQHSVIGEQMLNYAPASNRDGLNEIPERILCSGPATCEQLRCWGIPSTRLQVGGALRFTDGRAPIRERNAPVFVALPFDSITAAEMVAAARAAVANGHRFLVKDHPMTPYDFDETTNVLRTDKPLNDHAAVAAVVYAATTVGLEAILAGLPTLRFRPKGRLALDVLPQGVSAPAVEATTLDAALISPPAPPPIRRDDIFAPVDMTLWQQVLQQGGT